MIFAEVYELMPPEREMIVACLQDCLLGIVEVADH
jgi:hypothetical protein